MGNQIGGAAHDFGCGDIACCSEAQHGVRASQNVIQNWRRQIVLHTEEEH